jgi:threonine dehydrogenase-like Zn-dependent dehydrogenase
VDGGKAVPIFRIGAADNCQIKPGDTVAVWGCGPVGQFAIKSAYLLGAERVIAIDRFAERLELASSQGRAETLNYEEVDVLDALRHMTGSAGTAGRSSSSKTSIATVNRSLHWARATNCLRRAESRRHCQTGTRTQACFWPPTPHR